MTVSPDHLALAQQGHLVAYSWIFHGPQAHVSFADTKESDRFIRGL